MGVAPPLEFGFSAGGDRRDLGLREAETRFITLSPLSTVIRLSVGRHGMGPHSMQT
jgi:hypothetical protein